LVLPSVATWTGHHVYHLFVARITERDRDQVARELAAHNIQTVVHYPIPIHLQKAYADLGCATGTFPAAETAARQILSLPIFPEITRDQVDYVALTLSRVLGA
jgi:dTDP-4-amino-4,6-dideoxygalactose transaminase